jgi:hypothetical protein
LGRNDVVQVYKFSGIRSKDKVYLGDITLRATKVRPSLSKLIIDTGISDIDCFQDMMKESGWTKKLGTVLRQRA